MDNKNTGDELLFTEEELKAVYLFQNYRGIKNDLGHMNKDSQEYIDTLKVLKMADRALKGLKNDFSVFIPDRKNGKKMDNQRPLYVDVLRYSFMEPNKYSSEEIIDKLTKKHSIILNASNLSKLKTKSLKLVSLFLK